MRVRRRLALAVATAVLAACADRRVSAPAAQVRDSAGVVIVESARPARGVGLELGDLLVDLGGDDPETSFYDVAGAVRLGDGRVVVADGGSARLRYFDASGRALGAFGGPGDGPEEFRVLQAVGAGPGDSLWVYDFSHGRLTFLDPDGRLARAVTLTPLPGPAVAVGRLSDGSFVFAELWSSRIGDVASEGLIRLPVALVRYSARGAMRDTLTTVPGRETLLRMDGGRMTMGTPPFGRSASYAAAGDLVVVGDQVSHEVRFVSARGGGPDRLVRWTGGDLTLRPGEVREWKDRQVAQAEAARRPAQRRYLEAAPIPQRRPAYDRILVGARGMIWVGDYALPGRDAAVFRVFDPQGVWRGSLRLPKRFRLEQIGPDWILGVRRDAQDVEHVQVVALRRSS